MMADKPTAEHLDWRTLLEAKANTDPAFIKALDDYFAPFAALPMVPGEDGKMSVKDGHPCLNCGERLTGLASVLLGRGGFRWGLAHGEGECSNCGWPARAYHRPHDEKGEMFFLNFVLQYHPDFVETREKRATGSAP